MSSDLPAVLSSSQTGILTAIRVHGSRLSLKFIEANWNIPPLTKRSRDNLPNPTTGADPYKPANVPAIGDLMDLFKFQ